MRRLILFLILAGLSAPTYLRAQSATDAQATGSISGTVVNSVTQQPVSGAEVMMRARIGFPSGPQGPQSGRTEADGRFSFSGLAPGRYVIFGTHAGYVPGPRRDSRSRVVVTLSAGQHIDDVMLALLPGGVISGHAFNEAHKPLSEVAVKAMKVAYEQGSRELQDAAETTTGKSGEYRIGGLAPGKYYLYGTYSGTVPNKQAINKAYVPLCYPGTSDSSACVELAVQGGDELAGMDFEFAPVPTVHLRGQVIDARTSTPAASSEVTILRDQGGGALVHVSEGTSDGKGSFEFKSLPPGSYTIVAQRTRRADLEKPISGIKTVDVRDVNVDNFQIEVAPGVDVSGEIHVDGKSDANLSAMTGTLEPAQNSALSALLPDVDNAPVRSDGSFVFHDVPAGNYRLQISPVPTGFYLKSAGEVDVLDGGINVGVGHAPPMMDLVLSSGAAQIEGTVLNEDKPVAGAAVILVPEGNAHSRASDYKTSITDRSGRFVLRGIAPGDYQVFAWEEIQNTPYADPDFLQQYQDRGKTVHLEDGDNTKVELNVIPSGEL